MFIADLNEVQLEYLVHYATMALEKKQKFKLAFDETDASLKYKIADYSWSPPIATERK